MSDPSQRDVESSEMREEDLEMEDEEEEEEMRVEELREQVAQEQVPEQAAPKSRGILTSRTLTLNALMDDGIIQPGKGVLSIDYLGQRFEADLLESGKIRWDGSEEEFNTPSSWAHFCKRLVNPIKRSGCGWASVKYMNKKLDIWKSIWARKQRVNSPFKGPGESLNTSPKPSQTISQSSPKGEGSTYNEVMKDGGINSSRLENSEERKNFESEVIRSELTSKSSSHVNLNGSSCIQTKTTPKIEGDPLNLTQLTTANQLREKSNQPSHNQLPPRKKSVSYSALGTRSLDIDPHTFVQCEKFDHHSKLQPFTVSIASNALLLMDFHCNLTKSEVIGYLGGRWDTNKQHLSIEQVFPCFCRLGDSDKAPLIEEDIKQNMMMKQLCLVGWYHSHPFSQSDPTLHDIDCQMSYQLKMRGSGSMYQPCLAFILSPFDRLSTTLDSQIQAFWVMPNLEHPAAYNIPMHVTFSIQRDSSLTEDILSDMKHLSEFYSGAQDKLCLKDQWKETVTYVEKIRASIKSKLPEDQLDSGTFLDYMLQLLRDMK